MNKESIRFYETVRDYFNIYMEKQRCMSEHTITAYRQAINQYLSYLTTEKKIKFENISFSDWNAANINDFLVYISEQKKVSTATRNQRLFALRGFLKYARIAQPETGALSLNAALISKAHGTQEPIGFLTEEEMTCLLAQPNTNTKVGIRDMCFMITMYDTAARDSEMLSLRLNSLSLDGKSPTIRLEGKGNKIRYTPLMLKTAKHLKRYLQIYHPTPQNPEDYLFYTVIHEKKHQMSDDNVARFIKKYVQQAKIINPLMPEKVTPHQFRHSRAMHLYRNGMPLQLLSEFMGHATLQSTLIYAYADTEMKRKAIEKSHGNDSCSNSSIVPDWQTDEDMIRRLYGLK